MKSNSKKREGFRLIEVIISMAIIAIISVGVYNGYMIIIKQTKAGQVKQTAALEGKKVIEEIKATDIEIPNSTVPDSILNIGDIILKNQITDGSGVYTRYLDENYSKCDNKDVSKYTEIITLSPTKAGGENITLNTSQPNTPSDSDYTVYLSREENEGNTNYYIRDIKDIKDNKKQLISSSKIILNVYMETKESKKTISIKDNNGKLLLSKDNLNKDNGINLYINFNEYKKSDISNLELKPIEINVYNRNEDTSNIYIQKSKDLTGVDLKICKGNINFYDNRAEDEEKAKIGTLYDIKIEIKNKDGDTLFTGYSKQNITG